MSIKNVIVSVLFCVGCSSTQLNYQPEELSNTTESIELLKKTLTYQAPKYSVKSVIVKPDYIKVISGANNHVNYIHFDYIGKISLHEKEEWRVVTVRGLHNSVIYRLYVKNENAAKDFINAVYTLKNHHKILQSELNRTTCP